MTIRLSTFLPGVPEHLVRAALATAGGNEIESGKLDSPESSAVLAVNAFSWFIERPADLPPFPGLADPDWPALRVDVERQMRFHGAADAIPGLMRRSRRAAMSSALSRSGSSPFATRRSSTFPKPMIATSGANG